MCFPLLLGALGLGGAASGAAGAASGASGIATAAQAIGAAVSAVGAIGSGMAQASAAKAQAAFNERQAQIEQDRGNFEAQREKERAQRLYARQRANFLASGVALEGSPTAVIEDAATETALDIAAIRYGSTLRSQNFQYQAKVDRMNAKSAMFGGIVGGASALAQGVTRIASPYRVA